MLEVIDAIGQGSKAPEVRQLLAPSRRALDRAGPAVHTPESSSLTEKIDII